MKNVAFVIIMALVGTLSSEAQIQKVDQEVYGMDCAPCAYGLERAFKKMDGLQNVRVSLNDGKAYLQLLKNNGLSLKKIQEEVKKNGFSAKKAEVVVEGTLINKNDDYELVTDTETFQIIPSVSDDLNSKLKPGKIILKGIVQDEEDGELTDEWKIKLTEVL